MYIANSILRLYLILYYTLHTMHSHLSYPAIIFSSNYFVCVVMLYIILLPREKIVLCSLQYVGLTGNNSLEYVFLLNYLSSFILGYFSCWSIFTMWPLPFPFCDGIWLIYTIHIRDKKNRERCEEYYTYKHILFASLVHGTFQWLIIIDAYYISINKSKQKIE